MNLILSFGSRWLTSGWVWKWLVRDSVVIGGFHTWSIFNASWLTQAGRMMFWHHHFDRLAAVVGFDVEVFPWRFWNWLSCHFQHFLWSHFQSVLAGYGTRSWWQVRHTMIMPNGWWYPRLWWIIWSWLVHHGFIKWETNSRIPFATCALFLRYNILFLFFLIGPIVRLTFLLLKFLVSWIFYFIILNFYFLIWFWKSILALSKLVLCFAHFLICISFSLFALNASLAFDSLPWKGLGILFYLQRCFFYFFWVYQVSVVLLMMLRIGADGMSLGRWLALNMRLVNIVLVVMVAFSHSLLFHLLRLEMFSLMMMTSASRIFLRPVSQLVLIHVKLELLASKVDLVLIDDELRQ